MNYDPNRLDSYIEKTKDFKDLDPGLVAKPYAHRNKLAKNSLGAAAHTNRLLRKAVTEAEAKKAELAEQANEGDNSVEVNEFTGKPVLKTGIKGPYSKPAVNLSSYYKNRSPELKRKFIKSLPQVELPKYTPPPPMIIEPVNIPVLFENQPWGRLEHEPLEWYIRFEIFRKLPPYRRSVLGAYNVERQMVGIPVNGGTANVPTTWLEAAQVYRWKDRAEAFTIWDAQRQQMEEESERLEARKRRRQIFETYQTKVEAALQMFIPTRVSLTALNDAMRTIMQESRAEYADTPAQKMEITNMGDQDLVSLILQFAEKANRSNVEMLNAGNVSDDSEDY